MQDIRRCLNEIIKNRKPITITRNNEHSKLILRISFPYNKFGLNENDWTLINTWCQHSWGSELEDLNDKINNEFLTYIRPRYENVLKALLPKETLPEIVLSIICQYGEDMALSSLKAENDPPLSVDEYLYDIKTLSQLPIQSYSAATVYEMDAYEDVSNYNVINGVNLIQWEQALGPSGYKNEIYGLVHIWDHYDYPHLHVVTNYEQDRLLRLNAIKRTWLAQLTTSAGLQEHGRRVNYGYLNEVLMPAYTNDQIDHLGKLNYGTVISPPMNVNRVRQMSLDEIEKKVIRLLSCQRFKPTINIVYITQSQLMQERELGNQPIEYRYRIVQPLLFNDNLTLYPVYRTSLLPIGEEFDVTILKDQVAIEYKQVKPFLKPNQPTSPFHDNELRISLNNNSSVVPKNDYEIYLSMLQSWASNQFSTSNIAKYVAPDGISIITTTQAEGVIAYMCLNLDVEGINLNLIDESPNRIDQLVQTSHFPDYTLSVTMLDELLMFSALLDDRFQSMNYAIINPKLNPRIFQKLLAYNDIRYNVYSNDGTIGMKVDSLFSFPVLSSNMLYIVIDEDQYLNDIVSFNLFTSEFALKTFYSIELVNFSVENMLGAVNSIIQSIKLILQTESAKISFMPLIMSPYNVGVRIVFSLEDLPSIISEYTEVTEIDVRPFCRVISTFEVYKNPAKSNIYPESIIARNGTPFSIRCQDNKLQSALGFATSISRYTKTQLFSTNYNFYEIEGIIDQSRIAVMDRLRMFRKNVEILPEQFIPQTFMSSPTRSFKLDFFEIVTNADRMLLYLYRLESDLLSNNLVDFGSADFLNLRLTNGDYTMYDIESINTNNVPNVTFIQGKLPWGEKLPSAGFDDVLIYNSLFFNDQSIDEDMSLPIIEMLSGILDSNNIYFNLPYMNQKMYDILLPLGIVELVNDRYFLKLSNYKAVPCVNDNELQAILSSFPSPQWETQIIKPTLLDYYYLSRMIQRVATSEDYFNALTLRSVVPLIMVLKQ